MSGKGRGRGWLNIDKSSNYGDVRPGDNLHPPHSPANYTTPPIVSPVAANPQFDKIVHAITHFNDNDDGILLNQKFRYVKEVFSDACKTTTDAENGIEYVYNKALNDSSFTDKFVTYVSLVTFRDLVIADLKVRIKFLSILQESYNNATVMHSTNPHNFRNAVRIITGFYEKATMATVERNYKMLVPAILHCLTMLLDSEVAEDIELFTTQLYSCGPKFMEDSIDLKEVFFKIRTILACKSSALTENSKLWLLFAMDLSNNEFRVISTDLLNFYQMKLGSKEIFNFKKPLTVECAISSVNNKLNEYSSDVNVLEIDTNVAKIQITNTDNHARVTKSPHAVEKMENNDMMWNGNKNQQQQQPPPMKYRPKSNATTGRPILGSGARNNTNRTQNHADNTGTSNWRNHKDAASPEGQGNMLRKPKKGWEHDDRFETEYN